MPFIKTMTNVKVSEETRARMFAQLGEKISIWPGKREEHLMLCIQDGCHMAHAGKNDLPMAYVEVLLYGGEDVPEREAMTQAITSMLKKELGIAPPQAYIRYEITREWAVGGQNL